MSRIRFTAVWVPRGEVPEVYASGILSLIACLGEADPLMARWFRVGSAREVALRQEVERSKGELVSMITREVHDSMLGFGLWNGRDAPEDATITLTCVIGQSGGIAAFNSIQFVPPQGRSTNLDHDRETLRCVVAAFDPDSATSELLGQTRRSGARQVGSLTYVAAETIALPSLPAPAQAVPFQKGSLIDLSHLSDDERFMETAEEVTEILNHAGLLEPTGFWQ